jgi:hypothetical protein
MRNVIKTAGFVILLLLMLNTASQSEQRRAGAANCSCAERALRDIRSVKIGMTRRDLEKVLTTEAESPREIRGPMYIRTAVT